MLLHDARRAARVDAAGRSSPLDEQDRALWDAGPHPRGRCALLERALRLRRARPLPAAGGDRRAARRGARAPSETDWGQIAALYGALALLEPSPVVELNRAVAVAFAAGPEAGLELLEPLLGDPALERYQPLHAAHAELLRRAGDAGGADAAYERAIALSANAVERAELEQRRARLG